MTNQNQTTFVVTFVKPTQSQKGAKVIMGDGVSAMGHGAISEDFIKISYHRGGWTKHLADLFGILGFILKPLFASFSGKRQSHTLRWENIQLVQFNPNQSAVEVCGLGEEDNRLWHCLFTCAAYPQLSEKLNEFPQVQEVVKRL